MKKNIIIVILTILLIISISLNILNLNNKQENENMQTEYNNIICEKKSVESNNRNIKMEFVVDIYGAIVKTINTAEYVFTEPKSYNYYKELYQKYNDANYSYDDQNKKVYYTVIEEYDDDKQLWVKDYINNYTIDGYTCRKK